MRTQLFAALAFSSLFSVSAAAQTRAQLVSDWERQRANVLAYLDAMPDSAMGYRPTPGVRDFAQQIEHFVTTNLEVATRALRGASAPPFALDTTQMHQKAVLRDYTARVYDYLLESLRTATPTQLMKQTAMYNQVPQSTSRLLFLAYEHAAWTLGQTVPYLRLNGVTPPSYRQPF
jgi:hypothetical protein